MKYIYHHLGLGDHIINNGIVRFFKEIHEEVGVFCKNHNFKNVEYMFRDDDKIKVLPFDGDEQVRNYVSENDLGKDVIIVGFDLLEWGKDTFDVGFYKSANVPFDYRFSKFYLERDFDVENEVYKKENPLDEKFIFIHGDIDKNKIRNDLKIIENPTYCGIFNILKLIERAEEVHLMESSIKCLVNSYKLEKPKFFYHQYVRGYDDFLNSKGLNEFQIIY